LLRKGIAVSLVDLVTIRGFRVYAQLMEFIGHPDQTMSTAEPPFYAASCRWVTKGPRALRQALSHTLVIGQRLPTLPLWLREDLVVALDLEQSHEQACSTPCPEAAVERTISLELGGDTACSLKPGRLMHDPPSSGLDIETLSMSGMSRSPSPVCQGGLRSLQYLKLSKQDVDFAGARC
jgi:hypothetical protein